MAEALWRQVSSARVFDLSHALESAMPVSPNHPGFRMALLRRHGDMVRTDGGSAANEMVMMGGHSGTHFDALCHVSQNGKLYGGIDAAANQLGGSMKELGLDSVPPILCRGVLLDVAGARGVRVLPAGEAVAGEELQAVAEGQGVSLQEGDAVLIRTGWDAHWRDADTFLGATGGAPGPDESGASWLMDRGIRLTGSDTVAFEHIPPGAGHRLLPVHRMLLVEYGANIIEAMNLTELAAAETFEFLFIVTPLRIVGATGVPVRPLAVSP